MLKELAAVAFLMFANPSNGHAITAKELSLNDDGTVAVAGQMVDLGSGIGGMLADGVCCCNGADCGACNNRCTVKP